MLGLGGTRALARTPGANDAIGVAVIGLHGRGQTHLEMIAATKGLRLVGLATSIPRFWHANVRKAADRGDRVFAESDVRRLLDRKDIDAVTIATPNHWHSLVGIWACQAGKDVYIEKPVSHNVWEGRQLVRAARKYQRMVQTGTQARANPDVIEAVAWLRAGNLGTIRHAHGICYKPRLSIGKVGHGEIPPGWTTTSGPARRRCKPLTRQNLHYDWHWIYDYGNGDLGNQGIHEMDLARWFLGHAGLAPRVMSIGGRLGYDDDGETPNTQLVCHAYDGPPLVFEVRGLPKSREYQANAALWGQTWIPRRLPRPPDHRRDRRLRRRPVGHRRRRRGPPGHGCSGQGHPPLREDGPQAGHRLVQGRPLHLRELARRHALPPMGRPGRRRPRGPPVQRPVPHGHDLPSARPRHARRADPRAGPIRRSRRRASSRR